MKHVTLHLLLLLGSILAPAAVRSQALPEATVARIDSLFSDWNSTQTPGAVLAIVKDGQPLFQRAFGMADVAAREKLSLNHSFWVASMTKQFTAMGIALLAEQGKLSLEDDIRKYLPELPFMGDTVRVRHLIYHTSGIRDGFTLIGLTFRGEKHYTNREVLRMLQKQKALNFTPGTRYEYNNSGYVLLAEIIARVSGTSYDSYVESHILKPLGMVHSKMAGQIDNRTPGLAKGYTSRYKGGRASYRAKHFKGHTSGSTGLITTLDDLLRWDANFYHNQVGKGNPALIEQVLTPGTLNDGTPTAYAYGLEVVRGGKYLTISHSGADPGYKAEMVRFPEHNMTLICLSNTDNVWSMTQKLIQLGESIIEAGASPAVSAPSVSPTVLASELTGVYLHPDNQADIRFISTKNGQLHAAASASGYQVPLVPTIPDCFQNSGLKVSELHFKRDNEGEVAGLEVVERDQKLVLQKVQPATYTPEALKAFTGKYYSPELDRHYRLKVRKKKLVMSIYGLIHIPLHPLDQNRFAADLMGNNCFAFRKDATGRVTGFSFSRAAVTHLQFNKIH